MRLWLKVQNNFVLLTINTVKSEWVLTQMLQLCIISATIMWRSAHKYEETKMKPDDTFEAKFFQVICLTLILFFVVDVNTQAADITDGMIGYWPLDGNAKDMSGNNYHGELDGKVTWKAEGKVGGAANFDGAGSHIKVAQKDLAPIVAEFTVVTWINGYKANDWAAFVAARGNGAQAYWMGYHGGDDTLTYVYNNNAAETWDWGGSIKIPKDTWALVAVAIGKKEATAYAYTAGTKKLELAVNKIKHFEQAPLNFVFGKDDCCGERFYKGLLDEVMMFERTLNKDEIMQLATIGLNVESKNKLATSWGQIKEVHGFN